MAKIVDITEKLSLEKPQIKIGKEMLNVNDEAVRMLEVVPLLNGEMNAETIERICGTIFSEEDYAKIKQMKLNIKNFRILFETAMSLVMDSDDEGEVPTHATT